MLYVGLLVLSPIIGLYFYYQQVNEASLIIDKNGRFMGLYYNIKFDKFLAGALFYIPFAWMLKIRDMQVWILTWFGIKR